MSQPFDITAIGTKITIVDLLFPAGITLTQAPQDGTFWEVDNVTIANVMVGLNGNQISHSVPSVITLRISVIPNSDDDKNLKAMAAYNRPQGMSFNADYIQIYKQEANGSKSIYGDFKMTEVPMDNSANADGSFSTRTYTFSGVSKVA